MNSEKAGISASRNGRRVFRSFRTPGLMNQEGLCRTYP